MAASFLTDHDIAAVPVHDGVTAERFRDEIVPAAQPCILRGLVAHWPAVTEAARSDEALAGYLRDLDAGAAATAFVAPPEVGGRYFYDAAMTGFNFQRREGQIGAIIQNLLDLRGQPGAPGIYAGATSSDQLFPGFAAANPMPLLGEEVRPLAWIGNRSRVAPHFDTSENIACVVAGTRRFLLFPPDQVENLYVGPIDHTMAGQPASLVDPRAIDADRFPNFSKALAVARVADLGPGDAIFIPSMWWHYVEADGAFNMLVNYWWNAADAARSMDCLALALLVIRDLPKAQRHAWRDMFEHYVFSENAASAADHIPAPVRGALGPASVTRDAWIKQFLRARLPSLLQ